jgi:hypothetical protein
MANGRTVNIQFDPNDLNHVWTSVHENSSQVCGRLYNVALPDFDPAQVVQDMAATATALQGLLGQAIATAPNPTRLHCIGSGWSLSNAPIVSTTSSDMWMLSTVGMNLCWKMQPAQINPAYPGAANGGLYLAQGGLNIRDLNDTVEADGQSLKTCGASNGQTIAGAVATGTHGSAFQFGAMPEFIVGIHLITSPTTNVWLERASYPVVADAFITELGAKLTRDDDLFNAALVSFGSFGIVAGMMVETVPKYLLRGQRIKLSVNSDFLQAMNTMQLAALPLNNPGQTPWHFEVTFLPPDLSLNSGTIQGSGYVQTFYKAPYPANGQYNHPALPNGISPGESLLGVIGSLAAVLPVDWFAGVIRSGLPLYPVPPVPVFGTCGEIFTDGINTLQGKGMSMEMGISADQAAAVLQLILSSPVIGNYLGVISYRWVKQTSAMLGWTKFPLTATIEFNASFNDNTIRFYQSVWNALTTNGIPFTLHWGQMNNFSPALVRQMYGPAIATWLACRNRLMDSAMQGVFSSDFLISTGLDISQNPPVAPS